MTTDDSILENLERIRDRRQKAEAVKRAPERETINRTDAQRDTASLFGYPIRHGQVFTKEQLEDSSIDIADILNGAIEELAREWGILVSDEDLQREREDNQRALDELWSSRP